MNDLQRKKLQGELNLAELQLPEQIPANVTPKAIVDGIVGPRLEELYKYVGEEIDKSGFAKQIPSGLVITGGGSLTIGMIEMGKKIIGMPIRIGTPEKVTGLVDEILDPQFATTIGLIFYGRGHIMDVRAPSKDFNKILKDVSFGNAWGKVRNLLKQFIP